MANETYYQRMQRKLTEAFAPTHLEINDDSRKHAGHAGHDPRGETHFTVTIVSSAFNGMNKVTRHREIYRVLDTELKERVHALSLIVAASDEYTHR